MQNTRKVFYEGIEVNIELKRDVNQTPVHLQLWIGNPVRTSENIAVAYWENKSSCPPLLVFLVKAMTV